MSGEKPTVATTLTEQVKAFEAVVDWAKTRKDLRPPQKEGVTVRWNQARVQRCGGFR
jgi:hypothetical protein